MLKPENYNILLVDDELDSVKPLMCALERQGYKPRYVPSSDEALASIQQEMPDLILVDVLLGQDNGFDLFRKIRALPNGQDITMLFLSGLGEVDNTVTGLNLGASDFILKPYDLREISARIALQLRLRSHEKLLQAQNEELQKAYEQLRTAQAQAIQAEKMATIGRLSAGIAHEMSTPLSFIISNLKMLVEYLRDLEQAIEGYHALAVDCAGGADAGKAATQARSVLELAERLDLPAVRKELKDLSKDCLEGSEMIAKIANDLREFSRDEFEDRVPSDLNALIEKALNLIRNETGDRIRVERDFGTLPTYACIPSRMTQLFLILLVNASQAIEKEGVVHVKTQATPQHIIVTIADNGCGIKESELTHIFEPFFTTKPAEKGTGLGLSIAQKIVAYHNGTIAAKSEVGKGSVFTMTFPVK